MKRLLSLFTALILSCIIFASCQINSGIINGGSSNRESLRFSESTSESFDVSDSESFDEDSSESKEDNESDEASESLNESTSSEESDDREKGVYYITLDYNGYGEKNSVKRIVVKKGDKIFGLPEKVYSSLNSDFEYWSYNGKKLKNGMTYDYDLDITAVANYSEWTGNY